MLNRGDMLIVTHVDANGVATLIPWGEDGSAVEVVRVENEHGQVVYMSREEHEGRKNGTWKTYQG